MHRAERFMGETLSKKRNMSVRALNGLGVRHKQESW